MLSHWMLFYEQQRGLYLGLYLGLAKRWFSSCSVLKYSCYIYGLKAGDREDRICFLNIILYGSALNGKFCLIFQSWSLWIENVFPARRKILYQDELKILHLPKTLFQVATAMSLQIDCKICQILLFRFYFCDITSACTTVYNTLFVPFPLIIVNSPLSMGWGSGWNSRNMLGETRFNNAKCFV